MINMKYRPDIDGLRTIAVMAVVLYHAGVTTLSGGFVGVDVFFVISGFLITRTIVDEYTETGSFSFSRFYTRRTRRLFPALAFIIIISFIFAFILFSPELMKDFTGSAVYSLFSLSNFYFWYGSGYFDANAITKPLLHTWSLSVEEQFYLIWPVLLIFILSKFTQKSAFIFLFIVSLLSIALAQRLIGRSPSEAFFLLPSRIFEFGIGGILVWLIKYQPKNKLTLEPLLVVGLAMIMWPLFTYTTETPFPGGNALLPCIGAALTIYAGTAEKVGILLRNPISVLIGKASYSIYLVHWPLIVFYFSFTNRELSTTGILIVVILSVFLGWLQYRYIEERFRHEKKNRAWSRPAFGLGCALTAMLILLPVTTIWADNGAAWRVPNKRITKTSLEFRREQDRLFCRSYNPAIPKDTVFCQNFRNKDKDLIIWGDSHALHLVPGASKAYPDHNIYVIYRAGCAPQSGFGGYMQTSYGKREANWCVQHNKAAIEFIKSHTPSDVIVTGLKISSPEQVAPGINEVIKQLSSLHNNVIYLADFINPGTDILNCMKAPSYIISDKDIAEKCTGLSNKVKAELAYNEKLQDLVPNFVNIDDVQCKDQKCVFVHKNKPLFRDDNHLSYIGAQHFFPKLKSLMPFQ